MTTRVLVIGCGNIGAGYDFDDDHVWTHVKAFAERENVALTVSDIDESKARRVAERYRACWLRDVTDALIREQDVVSICVPTAAHMDFISRIVAHQIPVVVCEKPLVGALADIDALERLDLGRTRIIVNYMRRFQPGYADVQRSLEPQWQNDPPLSITVRYGRGFINNAGHAFDLLAFLLGSPFEAESVTWVAAVEDGLENDPTRSGVWKWSGIPIFATGLAGTQYFLLEIDIHTRSRHIAISESGDRVDVYGFDPATGRKRLEATWTSLLTDYMRPVANAAFACLNGRAETNFDSALKLNKAMLRMTQ